MHGRLSSGNDTSFTVKFDLASSTVTVPTFNVTCIAGNGVPYTTKVDGFTKTVTDDELEKALSHKVGLSQYSLSSKSFSRTEGDYTLLGTVARF